MTSNPTKDGLRYTEYGMVEMGFVGWCPRRYLLEDLRSERINVHAIEPYLEQIEFTSQIFVVEKTEEIIRGVVERGGNDPI